MTPLFAAANVNGIATKAGMILLTEIFAVAASVDARICGVRRTFRLRWD
jgi:hypothetical protein